MAKKIKLGVDHVIKPQAVETLRRCIENGNELVAAMTDRMLWNKDQLDCLEDVQEYLNSAKDRFSEVF